VQASDRAYYVYQALEDARAVLAAEGEAGAEVLRQAEANSTSASASADVLSAVESALCDDLNTPQAIALLSEPLKTLNDLMHTRKVRF